MAIKTPLAPHPTHYEQHCRRPFCLGNHKVGSQGQDSQARRHRGRALPLHTRPTALRPVGDVPQASQICPPLTQAPRLARARARRGGRAAEQACSFHLDRAVPTTPTVPGLQRLAIRAITQFHMLLSEICPVLCHNLPLPACQPCTSNNADRRTRLHPVDLHFVSLCSGSQRS